MPQKPEETGGGLQYDLPEIDDPTDILELLQDLHPGAREPIGALPEIDSLLEQDSNLTLLESEPEGSALANEIPQTQGLMAPSDDLEDFATQEEIPILPWRLQAEMLEIAHTLPAVLDPSRATTAWERPTPEPPRRLTVRLRMIVVTVIVEQTQADVECLRVGRDILSGRALILVE